MCTSSSRPRCPGTRFKRSQGTPPLRPPPSRKTSIWSLPGTRRSTRARRLALPFDTDARALFYNKDMITAAGEDPAKLDIANGPATIDEEAAYR